ncbi:hypothetical protein CBM2615_B190302 [Cupriavidus taiwanensis]|uniref:Uncharacterized protein n=1 Tax=Cupriavidus taiwanensis TaxID=164546 RepID=A0A375EAW3_9BURK|nr:hypothetical protein CBM2614_B200303 [Cupriavidus taiwanensis]SOZ67393.1 hypothetical protein CBM2615_B190302 [Cupriavidus taiwanensis]SOZ70828.1 hypothetical protein CBM2613_B170267 [Cupriavidus taiwanensis]SPA08979.1 hypothetical protein CBM2625_B170301 [Cupriavidus taiwanensis]
MTLHAVSPRNFQIGITKFGDACQWVQPARRDNFLNSHCEDTELPFAAALG